MLMDLRTTLVMKKEDVTANVMLKEKNVMNVMLSITLSPNVLVRYWNVLKMT